MSTRKQIIENAMERLDSTATKRQKEASKLYVGAKQGDMKAQNKLREGISTSDIPELLTPAINVEFLAKYAEQPTVWEQIAESYESRTLGTIDFGDFDFDTSELPPQNDGDEYVGAGLPGVAEYGEYPAVKFTTEQLTAELRKNGVRLRVSWEALIKMGDFDLIGRSTSAFARYAAEQEDITLAKQFVGTAGAINTAFTNLAGNTALTLESLGAAKTLSRAATVGGRRVNARSFSLVTGGALSDQASQLLAIKNVQRTAGSDVYDISPANGDVSPVNFWALDQVGGYTTPGATDDYWFLVPQGTARPAFLEVFLEGHRAPEISIKDSGHFYISGGEVPARQGSFREDDVETRARHVVQATLFESAGVIESDGTGTA
jgi:hypothetical protein